MKKILALLSLLSLNCFAASPSDSLKFQEKQDAVEYNVRMLNTIGITAAFPYPVNILKISEAKFNKKLVMLFRPKVYTTHENKSFAGYITCFIDEDKNLISILSHGDEILRNSVDEKISNLAQAQYCNKYLKYAVSKNEILLNDNKDIDEKRMIIKYNGYDKANLEDKEYKLF